MFLVRSFSATVVVTAFLAACGAEPVNDNGTLYGIN